MNYTSLLTWMLAILCLVAPARADVRRMVFSNGEEIDVQLLAPVPPSFEAGTSEWPGALLTDLRFRRHVKGGVRFADGSFNYSPPIAPTGIPLFPGAFAVNPANSDDFLISMNGSGDPTYNVIGTIISGMGWLMDVGQFGEYDLFGLSGIPVDSIGNPISQTGYNLWASMTLDGPIPEFPTTPIPAPEPATLAIFSPLLFALKRTHV